MNLIEIPFLFSLAILGIYVSFQWPGMIFRAVKEKLDTLLPYTLTKPLYNCPICMSSFWTLTLGTLCCVADLMPVPALCHAGTFWQSFALLILLIPAVAGICTFLCVLLDRVSEYGC
ncbi:MAG: hypothetical protein JSS76_19525 [Bacteroidetes bacterium]|nr:hypothetical protein [Bacteroidota bacterium]